MLAIDSFYNGSLSKGSYDHSGSFGGDDLVKKLVPDANKIYKLFLARNKITQNGILNFKQADWSNLTLLSLSKERVIKFRTKQETKDANIYQESSLKTSVYLLLITTKLKQLAFCICPKLIGNQNKELLYVINSLGRLEQNRIGGLQMDQQRQMEEFEILNIRQWIKSIRYSSFYLDGISNSRLLLHQYGMTYQGRNVIVSHSNDSKKKSELRQQFRRKFGQDVIDG